jgi:hypothetical protein
MKSFRVKFEICGRAGSATVKAKTEGGARDVIRGTLKFQEITEIGPAEEKKESTFDKVIKDLFNMLGR